MITPQSSVTLCNVPFNSTYEHIVNFSNSTKQMEYFNGLSNKKSYTQCTYIRHENYITIPTGIEQIENYNYLYYLNTGFTNKYHFAFIKKFEYVNENCTKVYIELDVWQTYQFDITMNRCLVEREHTNNDTIGANTVPENLEHGEYICYRRFYEGNDIGVGIQGWRRCFVIGGTFNISYNESENKFYATPSSSGERIYGGMMNGIRYYATNYAPDIGAILNAIDEAEDVSNEDITSLFEAPQWIIWDNIREEIRRGEPLIRTSPITADIQIILDRKIGNSVTGTYTPKNNKLYTKDYCYLYIDNGGGSAIDYAFEDFKIEHDSYTDEDVIKFTEYGVLTPGCSIKIVPKNYKGSENASYGLTLGKYATLSWSNDVYTNWLRQQGINSPIGRLEFSRYLTGAVGTAISDSTMLNSKKAVKKAGGGFTAGLIAGADIGIGAINYASNVAKETYMHSITPTAVEGNLNSGDVNSVNGFTRFSYNYMSIKPEYAKIIDEYFTMFGYKTNRVKVPNITGRRYWNYVKTVNSNITGEINQEMLNVLNEIFDKGVTIWHNASNIYNYSLNNTIN